eukprot:CAMPEP_0119533612 /NCGR_PEP_ID=MMETSP1344-20130328/46978_1 /TAXON_ID=236787 /ORGANISM="Florenciella parvula, Strain CCMP2471" /LENGTH=124 /DNA_ID=CAMNT_0007574557 /DNA_START=101 /DNA_END=472 /DNA_ORIENTATION=+
MAMAMAASVSSFMTPQRLTKADRTHSATRVSMVAVPSKVDESTTAAPAFTTMKKNIKQADPVPQSGIDEAVKLMESGTMYRYNVPDAESSVVSVCEKEITEYTGHKYCVALNSCGSALFLALLC